MIWLKENLGLLFLIVAVLMVAYYYFDSIRNPENYSTGTIEDQIYDSRDPNEFYAP